MNPISGRQYARAVAWRIAVVLPLVSGPEIMGVLHWTGVCSSCGYKLWVMVYSVRKLVLLGVIASLVWPTRRRLKTIGLPPVLAFAPALLLVADWQWFLSGTDWWISIGGVAGPLLTVAGMLCLILLAATDFSGDAKGARERFGIFGCTTVVALPFVCAVAAARFAISIGRHVGLPPIPQNVIHLVDYGRQISAVIMAICLIPLIVREWPRRARR